MTPSGEAHVGRWWMGTGSVVDFTSDAASEWWSELARPVFELGVEGVKADDGEGYYFPPDARFADGRTGAEAAWAYGRLYRETTQRSLDAVHGPGRGVVFGRSGWTGQQATGMLWGGDQASDFWSLRALLAALLTSAASGFSNLSHDVGGYLGRRLADRCEPELLVRWAQLGALTPLMQAHGRFKQEAWTYDARVLDRYREAVVLHERLVPYIRAAAATAARTGLPAMRPLCLVDPDDAEGWSIADSYFLGPALWVAPVVEEGATSRRTYLPRGDWIDWWTREPLEGGRWIDADAPLERIPLWVRSGSIVVTYPAEDVARGLGEEDPGRPIEATLWGEPPLGRAAARLADGTMVRWRSGSLDRRAPSARCGHGAGTSSRPGLRRRYLLLPGALPELPGEAGLLACPGGVPPVFPTAFPPLPPPELDEPPDLFWPGALPLLPGLPEPPLPFRSIQPSPTGREPAPCPWPCPCPCPCALALPFPFFGLGPAGPGWAAGGAPGVTPEGVVAGGAEGASDAGSSWFGSSMPTDSKAFSAGSGSLTPAVASPAAARGTRQKPSASWPTVFRREPERGPARSGLDGPCACAIRASSARRGTIAAAWLGRRRGHQRRAQRARELGQLGVLRRGSVQESHLIPFSAVAAHRVTPSRSSSRRTARSPRR